MRERVRKSAASALSVVLLKLAVLLVAWGGYLGSGLSMQWRTLPCSACYPSCLFLLTWPSPVGREEMLIDRERALDWTTWAEGRQK
jgi:hypothetical protein